MNISHTPGPWSVWCAADDVVLVKSGARTIAQVMHGSFTPSEADVVETAVNASLIACAPDLLGCLRRMHTAFRDHAAADTSAQLALASAESVINEATQGRA